MSRRRNVDDSGYDRCPEQQLKILIRPEHPCVGFLVSSRRDNPATLAGLKVWEVSEFRDSISQNERENIRILIATTENLHQEIMAYIDTSGLHNYICLYWMWKNRLQKKTETLGAQAGRKTEKEYYGLFHYRRILDIRKEDLYGLAENKVYASAPPEVFKQRYFYNYNLLVARRQIFADYCAWLFPILERTEQLSIPRGWERCDRYIGYLGENLMT